jgi:DNA-binding NarL/FixJ family response regulator
MQEITVTVVEDHRDLRNSLKLLLNSTPGFRCDCSYDRCEKLIISLKNGETAPQVILMDIGLPGIDGIEGVRQVKAIHPDARILMLTIYEDNQHVFQAICAGAEGYLLKHSDHEKIVQAIRQATADDIPMSPTIARKVITMFREFAPAPPQEAVHLTPREMEVLKALVEGLDYKQIAGRYFISLDTVRNHIRHIYEKLQVHSKSEAVAKALKQRLV